MLLRIWKKRSPPKLLLGMSIGVAITENSMEVPQKIKNRTTINDPVIPCLSMHLEERKSLS